MTNFENKSQIVAFTVNGKKREVILEGPQVTLAELIRDKLYLTGTKESCRCAECGACTVLVDGVPTLSCSTLAVAVRNKNILTIEGLAKSGKLHPLQEAFIEFNGIQCGFCSPGMILMAKTFLEENDHPTEEEIREAIGGNLCRCTGYTKIVEAISAAAQRKREGGEWW